MPNVYSSTDLFSSFPGLSLTVFFSFSLTFPDQYGIPDFSWFSKRVVNLLLTGVCCMQNLFATTVAVQWQTVAAIVAA